MASDHSLHKLLDYGTRTFTLFDVRHVHHVSSDDGLDIQPSQSAVVKTSDRCTHVVGVHTVCQGRAVGKFFLFRQLFSRPFVNIVRHSHRAGLRHGVVRVLSSWFCYVTSWLTG